jgi:hypothetical protein
MVAISIALLLYYVRPSGSIETRQAMHVYRNTEANPF